MSVSTELTLPDQPADGEVKLLPLGGNGYTSPQSYYLVSVGNDSDASGGTTTTRINLDPQYQGVIALICCRMVLAASDRVVRIDLLSRFTSILDRFSVHGVIDFDSDVGADFLFSPPPMFDMPSMRAVSDNIDTENLSTRLLVYNFKRDAFQKVPLNVLLQSLPRGFDLA